MIRQRADNLAALVPVRGPGVEPDIGKAILENYAVEAISRYTARRFLQRQTGIDAGEDAQLQVLFGFGAQVRSGVANERKADGGDGECP